MEYTTHADPVMVNHIIEGMGKGLSEAIVPGVTTEADILSAVFTVLHRLLEHEAEVEDPVLRARNAKEISRVLMEFLMEFGTNGSIN